MSALFVGLFVFLGVNLPGNVGSTDDDVLAVSRSRSRSRSWDALDDLG